MKKEAPRDIKLTQEKGAEQRGNWGCWTVGKISFLWP